MEPVSGVAMDPAPFILMAYCAGALGLFGFAHWAIWQRMRLRTQLAVVRPNIRESNDG